jgi:hypothetical protein
LLHFFSSFQYEHSTTYSKNSALESIEKIREERDVKSQIELESLEKMSEERDAKLQIELEAMIDNKKIDSSNIPFKLK